MSVIAQLAGSDDFLYELIFYLHVLTAIIGLGTVFLNGMYGQQALSRRGRGGAAVAEANWAVSNVAEYFIYAVFITGLLMGIMADEGSAAEISQSWVSIAMLLFIVALGISHGLLRPSLKKLNAILADEDGGTTSSGDAPETADEATVDALSKKVAVSGAVLNLLTLVILYLMVWKPGV